MSLFAGQPALSAPSDPLVSADDFAEWYGLGNGTAGSLTTSEQARIQTALEIASAAMRTKTGQQLSVTQSTVSIDSVDGVIILPQFPVVSVDAVTQTDPMSQPLTVTTLASPGDYTTVLADGYLTVTGPLVQPFAAPTVVTYTHGYDPLPRDLAGVCLSVAKRLYDNPDGREVQSETLGSWSTTYINPPGVGFTQYEEEVLLRYRGSFTY